MHVYEIRIIGWNENETHQDDTFKVVGDSWDSVNAYAGAYRRKHYGNNSYVVSVKQCGTQLVNIIKDGKRSAQSAFISYDITEF